MFPGDEDGDGLLDTYTHENARRDTDSSGSVDLQEFIDSHGPVVAAFRSLPEQGRLFIERAAGGFFDLLDLDSDGVLQLADLEAFAAAYGHPVAGIAANLDAMLDDLGAWVWASTAAAAGSLTLRRTDSRRCFSALMACCLAV